MEIISPLTYGESKKLKSISIASIIKEYRENLGIEVLPYLEKVDELLLLQCLDSGYKFFYPYNISGDDLFYQKLEKFDWYYMPWKWEHETIKNFLLGNENILEIGSGGLGFISKMKDFGFNITGLELNTKSVLEAELLNVNLINESIQEFSKNNPEKFDVVCSFQVLEHISEVHSFIKAQLVCLKKEGRLIISVPNNKSFIKYSKGGILNFPPHHMGLWDENSLRNLPKFFNVTVEKVFFEPLQDYHVPWYVDSVIIEKLKRIPLLGKLISSNSSRIFFEKIVRQFRLKFKGHTILVVYKKN